MCLWVKELARIDSNLWRCVKLAWPLRACALRGSNRFARSNSNLRRSTSADVLVVASPFSRSAKLHSHCCQPPHAIVVGVDSEEEGRDGRISSQSDLAYPSSMGAWGRSLGLLTCFLHVSQHHARPTSEALHFESLV